MKRNVHVDLFIVWLVEVIFNLLVIEKEKLNLRELNSCDIKENVTWPKNVSWAVQFFNVNSMQIGDVTSKHPTIWICRPPKWKYFFLICMIDISKFQPQPQTFTLHKLEQLFAKMDHASEMKIMMTISRPFVDVIEY